MTGRDLFGEQQRTARVDGPVAVQHGRGGGQQRTVAPGSGVVRDEHIDPPETFPGEGDDPCGRLRVGQVSADVDDASFAEQVFLDACDDGVDVVASPRQALVVGGRSG